MLKNVPPRKKCPKAAGDGDSGESQSHPQDRARRIRSQLEFRKGPNRRRGRLATRYQPEDGGRRG